jgi:hypothetical protein
MLSPPELDIEKVVIGYGLEALRFAKTNSAALLVNGTYVPNEVERKGHAEEWFRIAFELGMRGLTPIPSEIDSIRIEGNTAKITTEFYRMIKINFKELYVFDMERVSGIAVKEYIKNYIVYDWFDIKRGAKQPSCRILTPTDFVRKLIFYPSARKDGNDGSFKDCYTKSYIPSDMLQRFEYSETAAKFAAIKLIRKNGIRGPQRKFGDSVRYLNLVLQHDRREVYKHEKEFIIDDNLASNIYCCNVAEQWK